MSRLSYLCYYQGSIVLKMHSVSILEHISHFNRIKVWKLWMNPGWHLVYFVSRGYAISSRLIK